MNDKQPPKTNAERQKQWRARRQQDGYRREVVWLDPDVADLVDKALRDNPQENLTRLINDALKVACTHKR